MTRTIRQKDKSIDWPSVREQLAAANRATEEALAPSASRAASILEARARTLAKREATDSGDEARLELVVFTLAREHYAIETRFVREVLRLNSVAPVPGAPDFLLGLTSLRGEILPVFDSRKLFGLAAKGLSDLSRLIVLGEREAAFAILADHVEDVAEIPASAVEHSPHGESARAYLRGVTKSALIVLDGALLLSDAALFIGRPAAAPAVSRSA